MKFTEYDEYGLPTNDGENYKEFLPKDNDADVLETIFIPAPPEALAKLKQRPTGTRLDIDK